LSWNGGGNSKMRKSVVLKYAVLEMHKKVEEFVAKARCGAQLLAVSAPVGTKPPPPPDLLWQLTSH